jgi:hypothetical protein
MPPYYHQRVPRRTKGTTADHDEALGVLRDPDTGAVLGVEPSHSEWIFSP